jgi:hypothetical protein
MKFPAFYETWQSITFFIKAHYWHLSSTTWIKIQKDNFTCSLDTQKYWYLTLMGREKFEAFENKMLQRISGPT